MHNLMQYCESCKWLTWNSTSDLISLVVTLTELWSFRLMSFVDKWKHKCREKLCSSFSHTNLTLGHFSARITWKCNKKQNHLSRQAIWCAVLNIPLEAMGGTEGLKTMKRWRDFRGRKTQFQSSSQIESKQQQLQ